MSIELLELAAQRLKPLLDEVVFLGGATLTLWITDSGAPSPRPTKDVDVVVEAMTRSGFHAFGARLRSLGFSEDQEDGVICRWRDRESDLILDAMPADPSILGFSNVWQGASIPHAVSCALPSGARIRAAPPAYLLATKLEAFKSRGKEDRSRPTPRVNSPRRSSACCASYAAITSSASPLMGGAGSSRS